MELLRDFVSFLQKLVLVFVPFASLSFLFLDLLYLLLGHTLVIRLLSLLLLALFLRSWHALVSALEGKSSLLCIHEI